MQFTKMHGIGNDYIFVNCFNQPVPEAPSQLARIISNRHFGIGSDGLILILPSTVADAKMHIWNSDGSEAEMCGNGLRCVAKYFHDHIRRKDDILIETPSSVVLATIEKTTKNSTYVSINLGQAILDSEQIPTTLEGNPLLDIPIRVGSQVYSGNILSMGNPHCVLFVEELTDSLVNETGPVIENHDYFPERINVEFVQVINSELLKMRVWERGSGETLACGSGACASFAAGVLKGLIKKKAIVKLPGGYLQLSYDNKENIILTGAATEVFTGEWGNLAKSSRDTHPTQLDLSQGKIGINEVA